MSSAFLLTSASLQQCNCPDLSSITPPTYSYSHHGAYGLHTAALAVHLLSHPLTNCRSLQSSGVGLDDQCVEKFQELKLGKSACSRLQFHRRCCMGVAALAATPAPARHSAHTGRLCAASEDMTMACIFAGFGMASRECDSE